MLACASDNAQQISRPLIVYGMIFQLQNNIKLRVTQRGSQFLASIKGIA